MDDQEIADLETAEQDAAAAIGEFEQKNAEADAALKEERRAVNDRYREAAAALEAARVARADPNRPDPIEITLEQGNG